MNIDKLLDTIVYSGQFSAYELTQARAELDALVVENAKLRGFIEKIAKLPILDADDGSVVVASVTTKIVRLAREALK